MLCLRSAAPQFAPTPLSVLIPNASPEALQLMGAGLASEGWSRVRFLDHDGCAMCARPFEGGLFLGDDTLCSSCFDKPFPFSPRVPPVFMMRRSAA